MRFYEQIDCPICNEHGAVTIWERKIGGENKIHYFFKCSKCKREWH